jgi:AcrR family transcriptional regulator
MSPAPPARKPGPARKSRPARVRLDVDERRAQLVTLGRGAFSRRSYDEISIDDLAQEAGVSKGLLYHYFPTKRDFYVATVRESARLLLDSTFTPPETPPIERLGRGLDAYLAFAEREGPAFVSMLRGGVGMDSEVGRVIEETRGLFLQRLLEGIPAAPSPVLRLSLRGWLGFVEAATIDWLEHRDLGRDELRELFQRTLVEVLRPILGG